MDNFNEIIYQLKQLEKKLNKFDNDVVRLKDKKKIAILDMINKKKRNKIFEIIKLDNSVKYLNVNDKKVDNAKFTNLFKK